jgi:hypothetical protein
MTATVVVVAVTVVEQIEQPDQRDLNHRIRSAFPQLLGWQRAFRQPRRRDT